LQCPSWCSLQHEVPYYKLPKSNSLVLTTFGLWFVEVISQTITFCFITKILKLQTYKFNFKLLTLKMKLSLNVVQLNVLGLDVIVNTYIYIVVFFIHLNKQHHKQMPLVILIPQVNRNFMTSLVGPLFLNTPVLLLTCRLLVATLMLITWLYINLKSMSNSCHWIGIATNAMILKPLECL